MTTAFGRISEYGVAGRDPIVYVQDCRRNYTVSLDAC
jgi:hypothetical protein